MMDRYLLSAAILLSTVAANAQDSHTLSGRIVDENGQGIEYVSIGIPKDSVFTVSDFNGYFSLKIPEGKTKDIRFFLVSYENAFMSPEEYYSAEDSTIISLKYNELPEAVVVPGKAKSTTLLGKGVRWAGTYFGLSNKWGGITDDEWGSLIKVKRPTRLDKAELEARLNNADKAVLSFVVYKVEKSDDEEKTYIPVQHKPIYQTLTKKDGLKNLVFEEPEILILEPGEYYCGVKFVEFVGKGELDCKGYFKSAYDKDDDFKLPLSIGLMVTGTEYQD